MTIVDPHFLSGSMLVLAMVVAQVRSMEPGAKQTHMLDALGVHCRYGNGGNIKETNLKPPAKSCKSDLSQSKPVRVWTIYAYLVFMNPRGLVLNIPACSMHPKININKKLKRCCFWSPFLTWIRNPGNRPPQKKCSL